MEFSTLFSLASSHVKPGAVIGWLKSEQVDQGHYLDYIYVIFKLVLLNFYPTGSKLDFRNHRVEILKPGYFQTAIRTYNSWTGNGGSSWNDLHHLVTPLYYALKRLNPTKNEETRLIFLVAWRGLSSLHRTYATEEPPKEEAMRLISGTLMRMIEESFQGIELVPRYYLNADLDRNPLLGLSDDYWMFGGEAFKEIYKNILHLVVTEIRQFSIEAKDIEPIELKLSPIVERINQFIKKINEVNGQQNDSKFVMPVGKDFLTKNLDPTLNKMLRDYFWMWFIKIFVPPLPPDFWSSIMIPIDPGRHESQQEILFKWLSLLPSSENPSEEDGSIEKSYTMEEMIAEIQQGGNKAWSFLPDGTYRAFALPSGLD